MADELKRTYNIPLRKQFLKVAIYKRTNKAVKALKEFIAKHMKVEIKNVRLGKFLNEHMWSRGNKNPPHHVKVNILKDTKENKAIAELFGKPIEFYKKKEKEKKGIAEKVKEKLGIKEKKEKEKMTEEEEKIEQLEEKIEEAKEEKLEHAKEIEKEEIEELKKEILHKHEHRPKEIVEDKQMVKHRVGLKNPKDN